MLHNITDVMRKTWMNLAGPTKNIRDLSGKISTEDDKRCQTRGLDFVAQTPKTGSTVREEPQFAHHIFSNAFYPLAWLIHSFCWINSCGLPNFFFKSTVGWINWENPSLVVSLIEFQPHMEYNILSTSIHHPAISFSFPQGHGVSQAAKQWFTGSFA